LTDVVLLYMTAKLLLMVPPHLPVHTLLLSSKGTESLDRRLLV
jgi:hypothetical protein